MGDKSPRMPSKFDKLPLDVIKYEILPFISNDYFARMGINSMLQPVERISTPLRKNAVAELDMSFTMLLYKKKGLGKEIYEYTPSKMAEKLLSIFDFSINNTHFIKYHKNYHDAMKKKAETYANPNFIEYELIDERAPLILKATQMLEVLAKNPHICCVTPSYLNARWSPIEGATPCIVDNSELLEKIRLSKPHWREIEIKRGRTRRHNDVDEEYENYLYVREYGYFDSNDTWIKISPF